MVIGPLVAACVYSSSGLAAPPAVPNLCAPGQQVMFHCSFAGGKSVALCADKQGHQIAGLGYRYGRPGRIELAQQAAPSAAKTFTANVLPLAPGASVRQLSFTRTNVTYLLMQCVGGSCPSQARLAVLRGERVVSSRACVREAGDDRAFFSPELVQFGSDAASSRALTPLVAVDDIDYGIDQLYPRR